MKISVNKCESKMFPNLAAGGMNAASGKREAKVPITPFYSTAVLLVFTVVCISGRLTKLPKI